MKFTYLVRHNGIDYPIGADVPVEDKGNKVVAEKKEEVKAEPIVEEVKPNDTTNSYTRTEINRLTAEELRRLGAELGIKGAEDKSGSQLKRIIPEHLGI